MIQNFYSKVLPAQGVYCLTTIDRLEPDEDKRAKNHFADTLDQLNKLADSFKTGALDVYVALSSFKVRERKSAQSAYSRSFFIDLDVGDNPKKYLTKSDALVGLDNFIQEVQLPPPVRIDSGTGIHAYWIFDADLEIAVWKAYAEKFKSFCLARLKIDPVVTADTARIMRVPGSLNHKTDPPVPSIFLDKNIYSYDFDHFREFLDIHVTSPIQVIKTIPKGLDEDTKAVAKSDFKFDSSFQIIVEKSLAGKGCNQIKNIIINSKDLSEPLWQSGLSIAQHCTDRDTAIHLMSEDYPGYSYEKTEKKAIATSTPLPKPQSCIEFENRNPGGCSGCEYRGKITNPLALGRVVKELSTATAWVNGSTGPDFKFPDALKPFIRGATGGIFYVPPFEIDDESGARIQEPPILVSEHDLYPIKRIYNNTDGECLMVRYITPNDPVREFNIPTRIFHAQEELIKLVAERGLTFSPAAKGRYFMEYIIKWGQHLLNYQAAEQMRMQMGWTEDLSGFVVGNVEYKRDGTEIRTAASPLVHSISRLLKQQGDYTLWKMAADQLDIPGFEIHAFAMLCSFGSVLMRITSTAGISVGLVGGTGFGKTGALYAGLSLFGNPKELCLAGGKEQATSNGLVGWYMGLKNIMLGLDESSNRKPEELSNLIHQVAQGKGKIRMQASVNAVRDLELSASLIALFTSNQAIYDKLRMFKASPDGEMARMVELNLDRPSAMDTDPLLGEAIFDVFRTNFGFAGPDYIKELFRLGDVKIKEIVDKWILKFTKVFGKDTSYRFYENLIGVTFAGGEIAVKLGLMKWDLNRMFLIVVKEMTGLKGDLHINSLDYEGLLGEFQNKYLHSTIFVDKNNVIAEPKLNLVARAEIHNKIYYASARELRKFLNDSQVSIREFLIQLKALNILLYEGKQRLTTGWAGHTNAAPILVYGFLYDPKSTPVPQTT